MCFGANVTSDKDCTDIEMPLLQYPTASSLYIIMIDHLCRLTGLDVYGPNSKRIHA